MGYKLETLKMVEEVYGVPTDYSSKIEARDTITSKVRANVDQGLPPRGKKGTKSGVPPKITVTDDKGVKQTYETTRATQTAKGKQNIGLSLLKEFAGEDYILGLSEAEKRQFGSTGMIRGEFSRGDVLRWAKRLDPKTDDQGNIIRKSIWPEGKTIKGFVKSMNKAYRDVGVDIALRMSETGGVGFVFKGLGKGEFKQLHTGHIQSSINPDGLYQDAGANTRLNLSSQSAVGANVTDTGVPIGDKSQYANVPLGNQWPKDKESLRAVGLGGNVADAFGAYLMGDDDPNLKQWAQFGSREDYVKGRAAFEMGTGPGGTDLAPEAVLTAEALKQRNIINQEEIAKANVLQKPSPEDNFKAELIAKNKTLPNTIGLQKNTSSAQTYFNRIKSHLQSKGFQREAARLAGQSTIPWTNVAGDFVGVIYDGLAVAANPRDKQAIVDLFLSGTQAITSGVGAALIAVPEPTTSGLGYVIMKAGDHVGKLERLWNMQREGWQVATGKIKPGQIMSHIKPGQPGYTKSLVGSP